jgi:PAS domain S-box-containing protein
MNAADLYSRYQELQAYVNWQPGDADLVHATAGLLEPALAGLIDDFYAEIQRHPNALKVITGGQEQITRLKGTLTTWIRELLSGRYDSAYVVRRWRVGWRHVEIGLDQGYTNVALSRLRTGLLAALQQRWQGSEERLREAVRALNKLLDLDLAIIEDAYQTEDADRRQRMERLTTIGQVARAAPCLIVILRADATLLYFSPFAEEMTGYTAAEVLGKSYLDALVPQEHRQAAAEELHRAVGHRPSRGYESPVACKDGSWRWLVWNAQALQEYEGEPALLGVGQDITTLKEAQNRALQAERLAAIGQMVTGLAHESGNALARSQACLEMLALEVEDRPEAVDLIARIQKAQDHLRQLYDEVRGYASPLKLQRESWDLGSVWRQAWNNLAVVRQGRNASLKEHHAGVDLHCNIDPFRLEQVFRNIFENALAACRDPVVIDVRCALTKLGDHAAVRVAVRDNGPGLTPEQQKRIFDPFFTTKTKGTGLGMAIAKRVVDAHQGQIAVGLSGPGAEILLTLPRE